jgi:hypothetical protein
MPVRKSPDWSSLWVAVALLPIGLSMLFVFLNNPPSIKVIPYSDFQKYLDAGKVTKVTVSGDTISGDYRRGCQAAARPSGLTV